MRVDGIPSFPVAVRGGKRQEKSTRVLVYHRDMRVDGISCQRKTQTPTHACSVHALIPHEERQVEGE